MIEFYELGKIMGRISERRASALLLLETKFGPLTPAVRERVYALPPEELQKLVLELLKAQSLQELRLED